MPGWSKQMRGARVGKREGGGETGERTWMDGKVLGVNVRASHHKGQPENKGTHRSVVVHLGVLAV